MWKSDYTQTTNESKRKITRNIRKYLETNEKIYIYRYIAIDT